MVLTEEVHVAMNTATMETAREALEESIFGQPGANNEVELSRADTPPGWSGNTSAKVSRLGALGGQPIGPNTLQKVMAGDVLNATVLYYHQGSAGGNATNMVNPLLLSLGQAISGGSAVNSLVKNNVSNVTAQLGGTGGFINTVQPGGSNPSGNVPQAFLTIIFFDERFNFIPGADGGVAQQQVAATVGSNGSSLTLANVKAPKNGYAYVYISNQSNNHVYFDDMQVHVTAGNIIEENHYYAYGLRIAALSSRKLGNSYEGELKNKYLYQGAYAELDEDIGWNDFALRNYDAQIGRWVQQDPYQEFASPYVGMGNDPINLIDPSGGSILSGLTKAGTVAVFTIGGAIIGTAVDLISGGDGFKGTAIGAGIGLAAGFGFLIEKITVGMGIQMVNAATITFNFRMETGQVGTQNPPNISSTIKTSQGTWDPQAVEDLGSASYIINGYSWNYNETSKVFKLELIFNVTYSAAFAYMSVNSIERDNPGIFIETQAHETSHVDQYFEAAVSSGVTYSYNNKPYSGSADNVLAKIREEMITKLRTKLNEQSKSGKYKSQKDFDSYANGEIKMLNQEFEKIVRNILEQMQKKILEKFDKRRLTQNQIQEYEDDANRRAFRKLKGKMKYFNGEKPVRYKGKILPQKKKP